MKKKLFSMVLTLALIISALSAVPMTVQADSMMVVTVGADLTEEQKNMILKYFNVAGKSYTTIVVNNDDEWRHLGGYMSRDVVGYRTISCALIRPMTSGGIQVKTANLTYVTSNMIASNLATAGVTNCEVLAAAPFQVSGTGALTGALMAYENLSGVTLDSSKKEAAAQEFAATYELGQSVGQQQAQQIVNDMKMQIINGTLQEDNSITEEEIVEIVATVVNNYTDNSTNITNTNNTTITNNGLSESDIAALQELAVSIAQQSYEQGTLDALAQIQQTLEGQTQTPSTAATTQIEQNAASTAADTPADDGSGEAIEIIGSVADQALAADSLLTNTDESALAGTTDTGAVISSSTAESTIDTSVAINLDQQIEEEQGTAEFGSDDTGIPEPTDATVLGGEEQPAPAPAEELPPEEAPVEEAPVEEAPIEEAPVEAAPAMVRDSAITADDVRAGNAQLVAYNVTGDGSAQASGNAPMALVLPYDNMVPVSGALHVMNSSGAEVASLDITNPYADGSQQNILTVGVDPTISVPGGWNGYTKILLLPKDLNSGSAFSPAAGESYTYTLDGVFAQTADPFSTDGAPVLNVAIDNYTPYGGAVSSTGLVVNGYDFADPYYMNGASCSVLFPGDAAYAVVTADGQSMASVSTDSGAPGVVPGEGVFVTPIQSGKVTLTITYYAAAPEDGITVDPSAAIATANCSIQFTD